VAKFGTIMAKQNKCVPKKGERGMGRRAAYRAGWAVKVK